MYVSFQATESVDIPVPSAPIPIQHYLRQPQRLVSAIANPQLMRKLAEDLYELKMRPISFMGIYRFQPIVTLKVWSDSKGRIYLKSEACQIKGIDYINRRFALNLKGILVPEQRQNQTVLEGQADLEVKVDVPSAMIFTPQSIIEATGKSLLQSILSRIKQRLLTQLLSDYSQWANAATKGLDAKSTVSDLGLT